MLKLNVYFAMWMSLMAGILSTTGHWYSVPAAVAVMISATLIAHDLGIGRGDEQWEKLNSELGIKLM